jgi:hypothetical protein
MNSVLAIIDSNSANLLGELPVEVLGSRPPGLLLAREVGDFNGTGGASPHTYSTDQVRSERSELREVRQVPDQHHVCGVGDDPTNPRRRVIIWGETVALLGVDGEQPTPDFCRLAGPRLAGVDDSAGPNTDPVDFPVRHPGDVVGAAVDERRCGSSSSGFACPCWTR